MTTTPDENNTPVTRVSDGAVSKLQKPKLVIFDDKALLLTAFTAKFEKLGYDVTPIYVADKDYEWAVNDGLIKRGTIAPSDDWREQDKPQAPIRTLDTDLADARARLEAGNQRYAPFVRTYEAMQEFRYGVASKEQAKKVLKELENEGFKPDCILSDFEMRRAGDVKAGSEFMGDDAMALAKEIYPNAPRAVHTSLFSFYDAEDFHNFLHAPDNGEYNTEMYTDYLKNAEKGGYLLSGKDGAPETTDRSTAIHRYFKLALEMGKSPRIATGYEGRT